MRTAPAAFAALTAAVLLLTGCAGTLDVAEDVPSQQATADASPSADAPDVGPITAEPAPVPTETTPLTGEAAYLNQLHGWKFEDASQLPESVTDAQLLDAANAACEQLAEGITPEDVRVIDGETAVDVGNGEVEARDSLTIAHAARINICPDVVVNFR